MMNVPRRRVPQAAPRLVAAYAALAATALVDAGRRGRADRDGLPAAARRGTRARHLRCWASALDTQSAASWLGAHRRAGHRRGAVRGRAAPLCARLGPTARRPRSPRRRCARREPARMSAPRFAVELKDLRKSLRQDRDHPRHQPGRGAGERVAIIGPNGAGKSTLFNLISGRFGPTSGEILLNGKRIDGLQPYEINRLGLARSFQITNIFSRLSVFENLRCARALVARLPLRVLEVPRRPEGRQRSRRGADADDQARAQARHAGHEPHLRRAARARDRHHHRRRRRRGPARRADRRHEQERDRRASSS